MAGGEGLTITGVSVKIEVAMELADELRFEYLQLVYESEDLEFSDRSEAEILQELKSVRNQLRQIERAYLDDFILREVRTIVSEILSTRTRLHTLLMGVYAGLSGGDYSDNAPKFLFHLKEGINMMIHYKSGTLKPFMDRHGISLRTFLREFNDTKLNILFNSLVPSILLRDHKIKLKNQPSGKGDMRNQQQYVPEAIQAPFNTIVTSLHKTFEDFERLIATRMLAAEEMDN